MFFVLILAHIPSCPIIIVSCYLPINVSNKKQVDALTDLEVIERWRKIYIGPDIIQRFIDGEELSKEHYGLIAEIVDKWRQRLSDISWFIHCHPWRSSFGPA